LLFLILVAGFAFLIGGGELLVRGGVRPAHDAGVSPLVIGITIVGFGTSTPELVASVQAAFAGVPDLAVGNIVGSNISNILLILGIAALLRPIPVAPAIMRRDGVLVVATAVLLMAAGFTGTIGRLTGLAFVAGLVAYMWLLLRQPRVPGEVRLDGGNQRAGGAKTSSAIIMTVAGIVLVVAGGHLLVKGAVALAQLLNVADAVIGLTIVAVGTSLPELATTLMAVWRKAPDIALGNVLGSSVYNVLGIGGITAVITPLPVADHFLRVDMPVMVAVSIALVVLALKLETLGRLSGLVFLAGYGAYVALLFR
jgi:cation:H+ antiporter